MQKVTARKYLERKKSRTKSRNKISLKKPRLHCGAVCCCTALVPYSFILHFPYCFQIFSKQGKIISKKGAVRWNLYKKTYRVSEETKKTVEEIAAQEGCTETAVFENAIRYYKDYLYMQTDGGLHQ